MERGTLRKEFVNDWLLRYEVAQTNALDMDDGPEIKFLIRVLVVPSTSKVQAPFLQDVIQADVAHEGEIEEGFDLKPAHVKDQKVAKIGSA